MIRSFLLAASLTVAAASARAAEAQMRRDLYGGITAVRDMADQAARRDDF